MNLKIAAGIIGILTGILMAFNASGLEFDPKLPIRIDADRIEADQRQGVSRYVGNVVLTQGGITIRADSAEVRARSGRVVSVTATGKPVRFERAAAPGIEATSGSANQVEFHADTSRLDAAGDVVLKQGKHEFSGAAVHYSVADETVVVESGPNRRVQVIFEPDERMDLKLPTRDGKRDGKTTNGKP